MTFCHVLAVRSYTIQTQHIFFIILKEIRTTTYHISNHLTLCVERVQVKSRVHRLILVCPKLNDVILQEWMKLGDPSSQGMVTKHRTGNEPFPPPDNDTIQMKMAIVSWQPGPNRVLQIPSQVCCTLLIRLQKLSRNPGTSFQVVHPHQH